MKRILLLLLIAFPLASQAQVYNNEWIDYSKTYYKFKVGATGVYRISQTTLASAGLSTAPAEDFQLWRNGQQVPIYTTVQTGIMGSSDYIEFWGEMNDGKPDNVLYRVPDYQLNDKWNLLTDTVAYFLTAKPGANLRLTPTTNNVAGNTLPIEPFFMHTEGKYYKEKQNGGRAELVGDSYTYSSSYEYGESFTSNDIPNGITLQLLLNNLSVYTGPGAPAPVVKINASGNAVHPRWFKVKVNGDSVYGQTLNYYDYAKITAPVTITQIASSTANIEVTNMGTEPNDRFVVAQTELIYPRQFNFGGASNFYFELTANAAGNYLEISNFNYSGIAPVLYDLTNGKRYVADISNPALLKFALLPSGTARKMVLISQGPANISSITSLQQRNFIYYGLPANQGDYIIITHPTLTLASDGSNPVDDYKSYRSSPDGGGYNAKIYMIDELVDQFGLGIKKSPLSIRNFLRWARANFSAPLKDVLLIGKGVMYAQYKVYESDPNVEKLNLVPPFGHPASDNMLSAVPGTSVPQTPIGRISVISGDEVALYLTKVQQYEQVYHMSSPIVADQSWMKDIVHVVGASDEQTGDILLTALNGHKTIIEDTLFGGHVHTFAKNSADAVQQVENDKLTSLINNGVGILTYFGHSSSSALEFNLDNPMNYTNQGRYPIFVVMGCNAGNFFNFNMARFSTKETLSEKYVLAPERGSIAFLASTSLGIVHYLDIYNTKFYTALSTNKYGSTIGEVMDEAIREVFDLTTENDFYARFQCEQFTLHGDPALKFYNFPKADYAIEDPMVKVSPSFVSIADTNFYLRASIANIGKAVGDSIIVEVKRTYPDLSIPPEVIKRTKIKGIRSLDSLTYSIHIDPNRDKGLNKITITVDADNNVDELYETNNTVTKDIYIYEDEARPIYPYNLSIINQQNIKLVASSANPFAALRSYVMELDTTELFNSPMKVTRTTSTVGGVFDFSPGITFTDSTVYYWRIAPTVTTGSPSWNTASFIYMNGTSTGFNQSHYYQHEKSKNERILLKPDRSWVFDSVGHNIFVKNGVFLTATVQEGDLIVSLDSDPFIRSACVGYSLIFNIINPNTFAPVQNAPYGYPSRFGSGPICYASRSWNFEWTYTNAASRKLMMDFMDTIPNGYYVVVRSINNNTDIGGMIDAWKADTLLYGSGNSLYHKLKNLGFDKLDSFYTPRAVAFMYKKNDPSFIPKQAVSDGIYDLITLNADIKTPDTLGYINSPVVGPAKTWKELKWRGAMESPAEDSATIDVIGVDNAGIETVLFTGIGLSQQDFDISSVDAVMYPFMKLRMRSHDSTYFTPYQLRYWRLLYDPVPEGAIAPNIYLNTRETVEVGEPYNFGIGFKNISNVDFDSLKVKVIVTDKNNIDHFVPVPRQRKLTTTTPNDTLRLNVPIPTDSLAGNNTIFIDFNPDFDQPEQSLFNNFAFRNLYVKPDSLHPLLDVTFDGLHILNRDIVSPQPNILVKLKDEAKWMILNDTSLFSVHVRYPDGSLHKFAFDNDTLTFTPAGQAPNTDNTATVGFKPYFPQDGDYELVVTGKDRSNNAAGTVEYRIGFRVYNKPMISNMLNYPNPFTTSTAFVFTITGTEIPQNLRIQILTITGKIVRDITKEELGPLRIGRNITEFKWDGTDQYGQKLANGIYLYRVITNLRGKSLDKFTDKDFGDKTDKYFNNGYGKMYLMR